MIVGVLQADAREEERVYVHSEDGELEASVHGKRLCMQKEREKEASFERRAG